MRHLIVKGKNIFSPQYVNGGASCVLSSGRSAILWIPSLPLNLLHITHLKMMLLQTKFPFFTHKSKFLEQFKVNPLPPWATFWCYQLIIWVTSCLLGRRIGYFRLQFRKEFFNLPPTCRILLISRKISNLWMLLDLGMILLPFDFSTKWCFLDHLHIFGFCFIK